MPELNPTPNQNDMKSNSKFRYIEYLSTFYFVSSSDIIVRFIIPDGTRTKPKRAPILAGLKIRLIRTSSNPDRNSVDVAGSSRSYYFVSTTTTTTTTKNNNQTQHS
jgi:hypothetical protein